MLNSLRSIVLFGAGMLVPWGMIETGLATVGGDAGVARVIAECLALVI